ncbi:MAG: ferrochelatase [Actinobacteria bacterium]|nr:ferrochelatase [Actinomycetota bacterium]
MNGVGELARGALVMAYGTPERPEDLGAYYTDIRRGRPPSPEQLADLRRRYDAIGGLSPLAERTRAQVEGLQRVLDGRRPGGWRVALGLKHSSPTIEEGVTTLRSAGVQEAAFLVLAPHYSAVSVGQYHERAQRAWAAPARLVGAWYDAPGLIALLAERTRAALARLPAGMRTEVVVTAHSLPQRAAGLDQPSYPDQLHQTAALLAAAAGLASWRVAWQSAGRTPEPWLGPDILEVIRGLPGEGFDAVVVCPAGFTADHLEVLYDIDVEARAVAEAAGLRLERTASLNDDPRFLELLADLVADCGVPPGGRSGR